MPGSKIDTRPIQIKYLEGFFLIALDNPSTKNMSPSKKIRGAITKIKPELILRRATIGSVIM